MSDTPSQIPTSSPLLDELCERFEEDWLAGQPAQIEVVLASAPATLHPPLFRELLAIERDYRARAGRPLTVAEAQDRFAALGPWAEDAIQELVSGTSTWSVQTVPVPPEPIANAVCIGQYELLGDLGRGGHGIVFKARHTQLNRLVALKVLFPHRVQSPGGVRRFRREMQALGRLTHPHIIRATDAGQARGHYYLAMEYIDGADLGRVLKTVTHLTVADACEIAGQVAEALAYVDEHGMVHRDVKPSNLLLGRDGIIRLLDLGLAQLGEQSETLTETGVVMGTADFIAPEQARDSRSVDIHADVYSLGCTLYALLSGSPPFTGPAFDTPYKKFQAHNEAPVPPLGSRCAGLPAGLDALVARMLRKHPTERPMPMEVVAALAPFRVEHNLPALVPPPAPPAPLQALSLEEGPTRTLEELPSRTTSEFEATPRPHRRKILAMAAGGLVALAGVGVWWGTRREEHSPEKDDSPAPPSGGTDPPTVEPSPPSPRVLRPGEWTELLDRPPVEIPWPNNTTPPRPDFDAKKRELWVHCPDLGLLQLATLTEPGFDLEVAFLQSPWVGGVGVFFGQPEKSAGAAATWADFVYLWKLKDKESTGRLSRGQIQRFPANGQFAVSYRGGELIDKPQIGEHRLWVSVDASGKAEVLWDGNPGVPDGPNPPRPFRAAAASGPVGLFLQGSSTRFRSVRIRPHLVRK